jgi:hypothetical protein
MRQAKKTGGRKIKMETCKFCKEEFDGVESIFTGDRTAPKAHLDCWLHQTYAQAKDTVRVAREYGIIGMDAKHTPEPWEVTTQPETIQSAIAKAEGGEL